MIYTQIQNLSISKITLGTAQIGMEYGIANISGKPSFEEAYEILRVAINSGINCFDTAPIYNDSEKIIGSFLKKEVSQTNYPTLITKLPFIPDKNTLRSNRIRHKVFYEIQNSINLLQLNKIPIYLLHNVVNLFSHDGFVLNSLLEAKDQGMIEHVGVSVYTMHEILQSLEISEIEVIQVPFSILDQRVLKDGLLEHLKNKNIIVLARSIFLQGLIFLEVTKLPKKLQKAKDPLLRLQELSIAANISKEQLAFNYVRDFPGITSLILGVEKKEQLQKNIGLLSTSPLSTSLKQEIYEMFYDVPPEIIDPRNWNY